MKKANWFIALLVGVVMGAAGHRMLVGGGTARRAAPSRPAAAPTPPPIEDQRAVYRVPIDDTPLRGSADALVTVVVASEFQCPYCKRVDPTLKALLDAFPGKVRLGWKHLPLPFHAQALPAAVVAEEARAQGGDAKFWAMHDKLFEISPALDRAQLESAAQQVGLDVAKVREALDQGKHADKIRRDQALCQKLGANGTPTMFVNGHKVVGALPLEQLKPVVEQELRKAEAIVASGVAPRDVYAKVQENAATSIVYLPPGSPRPAPAAQAPARPTPPAVLPGGRAAVPVRRDDPAKGAAEAQVTMVVFSDFQCPFCARANPAVKDIEASYPKDVRIVWKHLPLSFHPNALPAALAAEAAREQGGAAKFWAMHDKLFSNQAALSETTYEQYARDLGLDLARFKRSMADPKLRARVEEDAQLAQNLGVNGTPTFVVNGERVVGAGGLRPTVDRLLAQAKAK